MSKHPCVICGDPNAFPLWVGGEAPDFCANDETFGEGRDAWRGPGACPRQRRKAEQAALMHKGCPEAFDENGNIRPGPEWLAMAIEALPPDWVIVI